MRDRLPTRDEFWSEVFPRQEPVVWRGGADHLELVQLARRGAPALAQALTERCGGRLVHATTQPPSAKGKLGFSVASWADWSRYTTSLGELVDELVRESERPTGRTVYMQAMPVRSELPEIAPLMDVWMSDAARMHAESTQLWMGGGGQRLAIHQDATHSVICMVSGQKDFLLFPPEQHFNLFTGPQKQLYKYPWRSVVDPLDYDEKRFPGFGKALASARRIHLEPGDVMFLPAGWWHGVDSHGFNVMFNTRWLDVDATRFDDASCSFAHAFLAARGLDPAAQRRFREELKEVAFGRAPGPLSPEARARFIAALRPVVAEAPAAHGDLWEQRLRLGKDARLVLTPEGVWLSSDRGAKHRLPWSFAPLMKAFVEAQTPRQALSLLREEFDVDEEQLLAHVRGLREAGALVPVDGEQAASVCTARSAIAHVALATAELPHHHRDAIERWIDIYAFRTEGDPYPYLPKAEQGALGAQPSAAVLRELEAVVRRSLRVTHRHLLVPDDARIRRWVMRPERGCAFIDGGVGFVDATSGMSHSVPWAHLELLALFAEPSRPAELFARVSKTFSTTTHAFDALVTSWIAAGVLVEADDVPSVPVPLSVADGQIVSRSRA